MDAHVSCQNDILIWVGICLEQNMNFMNKSELLVKPARASSWPFCFLGFWAVYDHKAVQPAMIGALMTAPALSRLRISLEQITH